MKAGGIHIVPVIELEENLKSQLMLLKELQKLATQKKEALIQNNIQEIDNITIQEEKVLFSISNCEEARLACAEQFGKDMGKEPEKLTLAELALKYTQLSPVYRELKATMEELQEIQSINSQLIDQALKMVNFTVNLLTPNETNTYQRPTQKDTVISKLHLLDKRI